MLRCCLTVAQLKALAYNRAEKDPICSNKARSCVQATSCR